MNKWTSVFALMLVALGLTGCLGGGAPKPKYALHLPMEASETLSLPASSLSVHLAQHLRRYTTSPLIYDRATHTVTPYRALVYYAPIDVLLEHLLEAHLSPTVSTPLRLTINEYAIVRDETGASHVQVALVCAGKQVKATTALSEAYTPAEVATAFNLALKAALLQLHL